MKKIFYTFLLVSLTLASCQKEQIKAEPVTASDYLTFKVTAVSPSVETPIKWQAESDRIGVFASSATSGEVLIDNAYYSAFSSTASSLFAPLRDDSRLNWEKAGALDVQIYYPYRKSYTSSSSLPLSVPANQTVEIEGTGESLKSSTLFATSLSNVSKTESGELDVALSPVVSFVKFNMTSNLPVICKSVTITGEDGSVLAFDKALYKLSDASISSVEGASSSVTVVPSSPVSLRRTPATFLAKLAPGYSGKKLVINCELDGADFVPVSIDVPEGGLKAGTCISYDAALSFEPVVLSENGTANSYIVNKANTLYAFNARVKGNGSSKSIDWSFDGKPQSSTFDAALNPSSAVLLWYSTPQTSAGFTQESPVVSQSLVYDEVEGMIYFKTPQKFVNGNAVIAALDASGEIIWSWNIWAVEGWSADATAHKAGRYTVMDRNLGAVLGVEAKSLSDNVLAAGAIGNYYQWGRKDPFPAASSYNSGTNVVEGWGNPAYTDQAAYKVSGDRIFSDERTDNARMLGQVLGSAYPLQKAVDESVKYPHKWMFGGNSDAVFPQYSWFSGDGDFQAKSILDNEQWRYLWGSTDNISNEKTIYDPCPAGWKVPTADAYATIFASSRLAEGGHGLYVSEYDLYFPFAGQRKAGFGGSVISASGEILMASASVANSLFPLRASVSSNGGGERITQSNSYSGAGLQLRCVKESVDGNAPGYGKQTGHRAALMGDSITNSWLYRGRLSFFTENNYLNRGIDGQTSSNMIDRFWSNIVADNPQSVVITCGTNDLAENMSNDEYHYRVHVSLENLLANIALMSRIAEDMEVPVILGSICPTRGMWWKPDAWKAEFDGDYIASMVVEANKLIKAYAQSHGYGYADYHSALKNEQNGLADEYCFVFGKKPDGSLNLDSVHPNAAAFLIMEDILKPLIDAALFDPSEANPGGGNIDDMDKWKW